MSTGKIGTADLAKNTDTLLGAAMNEDMVVNVRVVNRNSVSVKVRIAVGTGAGPAAADYISYDVPLPPGGVLEDSGLALSAGEKIWVRADAANVSARAHGLPAS